MRSVSPEMPSAPTKVLFCAFTTTRGSFAPTGFVFAAALLAAAAAAAATGPVPVCNACCTAVPPDISARL